MCLCYQSGQSKLDHLDSSHEVYFTIIDKEKLLLYQKNSLISVFERKDAQLSVKNVATFVVIKSIYLFQYIYVYPFSALEKCTITLIYLYVLFIIAGQKWGNCFAEMMPICFDFLIQ